MKILLIGGTGFLGSRIAEKLIGRNHQLTIITRDPSKPVSFDCTKVTLLKGDLTDAGSLNVTGEFDVVVYAAMVPFKPGRVSKKKFTGLEKLTRLYFENTIDNYTPTNHTGGWLGSLPTPAHRMADLRR